LLSTFTQRMPVADSTRIASEASLVVRRPTSLAGLSNQLRSCFMTDEKSMLRRRSTRRSPPMVRADICI